MLKRTRNILLAGALALGMASVPVAAQATVHPFYVAGASVAGKPVWDSATQHWKWTCTFAGWASGVTKNYSCKLEYGSAVLSEHDGSFTSSGQSLATFYTSKSEEVHLCTVAFAEYSDGSSYDSDTACN